MSVKTYSYKKDGNKFVSTHTQVMEMASKRLLKLYTDEVLISDELLSMLEALFAKLHCKKYIIQSGYRTPAHDRAVGGNGVGQHTKGKAVDAVFYDKDGRIIPAQIVCCAAQDLGFNGIANINKKYQSVHLDVGDRIKPYRGDEIKGTNSVTTDFYAYFSVKKSDVEKYTGVERPKIVYLPKYAGKSVSIVTALNTLKIDSHYAYREKIAKANNIVGYKGSAGQNGIMLSLLKQGKLIKP